MTKIIRGTNGSETLNGTTKSDVIEAKGGNDIVNAGKGDDIVDGGSGNDTINGGDGDDRLDGGSGNDTVDGGSGNDLVDGGDGDDVLAGGAGWDAIFGGDGNDTIDGGTGNDLIKGGDGTDTAIFSGDYGDYALLNLFGNVLINGEDGTDIVMQVEFLRFDDGVYDVATRTFVPDQPPPLAVVSVVATDGVGTEGGGDSPDFTFTFTRTGDLSQPLTVYYGVLPAPIDGASPGADFPAPGGTITFAAGSATAVLTFDATDDAVVENTELFAVVLQPGAGYTFNLGDGSATANAIIVDNDVAPPLPTLSISDAAVNEEAGTITFVVTLSAASATPVSFDYATADGSATAGADYAATAGVATIAPGQTTTTVTVPLLNDGVVEPGGETFVVALSNPVGATIADAQGTGTILEQDQLVVGTNGPDNNLQGGPGDDTVEGLDGDDGLGGGPGNDTLKGGAGFDRALDGNASVGISVALAAGLVTVGGSTDTLQSIEFVRGSNFDDTYNATGFAATGNPNNSSQGNNLNGFEGMGGNDTLTGNGNTRIEFTNAGAGVTVTFVTGTSGSATGDASVGTDGFTGVNRVRGSQFDDLIVNAGTANNVYDGQGGFDTVSYAGAGAAITANLQTGTVTGGGGNDNLLDNTGAVTIESVIGTGFDDTFVASGTNTFDGGFGVDTLFMNSAVDNVVTAISVETINGGVGNDTLNFIINDGSVNQSINLGGGTNIVNLGGTTTSFSFTLSGVAQVNGHAGVVDEQVNLLNVQGGATFDLGGGADTLTLYNDGTFVNVVTVENVEHVQTFGADSDQITIAGNVAGVTTVTAGGGPDFVTASADVDHIRFRMTGESPFDVPFGGQRDLVINFDADQDKFVFDGPEFVGTVDWELITFGGADIILVDTNGDGTLDANNDSVEGDYAGWEMAIGVDGLSGTLDDGDFWVV